MPQLLPDYVDAGARLVAEFQLLYDTGSAALRSNTADLPTLEHVRNEARELNGRIRQLRLSFDEVDVLVYEGVERADRRAFLWAFEKDFRSLLVDLSGELISLGQAADAVLDGQSTLAITLGREGETLQSIASRTTGSWQSWKDIQNLNRDAVAPGGDPAGLPVAYPKDGKLGPGVGGGRSFQRASVKR